MVFLIYGVGSFSSSVIDISNEAALVPHFFISSLYVFQREFLASINVLFIVLSVSVNAFQTVFNASFLSLAFAISQAACS